MTVLSLLIHEHRLSLHCFGSFDFFHHSFAVFIFLLHIDLIYVLLDFLPGYLFILGVANVNAIYCVLNFKFQIVHC